MSNNRVSKKSKSFWGTSRGFTLIEIMVALAIIAILLMTIIYTVNYNLKIIDDDELTTTLVTLAKAKMSELEDNKDKRDEKGKFPSPYDNFSYTASVADSSHVGVLLFTVEVNGNGKGVSLYEYLPK